MQHVIVDNICYDLKEPILEELPFITISLSKEAAQALIDVCQVIGGNPHTTPRKHFEAIRKALIAKGIHPLPKGEVFENTSASLYFK